MADGNTEEGTSSQECEVERNEICNFVFEATTKEFTKGQRCNRQKKVRMLIFVGGKKGEGAWKCCYKTWESVYRSPATVGRHGGAHMVGAYAWEISECMHSKTKK
jgi:hypothetical protein